MNCKKIVSIISCIILTLLVPNTAFAQNEIVGNANDTVITNNLTFSYEFVSVPTYYVIVEWNFDYATFIFTPDTKEWDFEKSEFINSETGKFKIDLTPTITVTNKSNRGINLEYNLELQENIGVDIKLLDNQNKEVKEPIFLPSADGSQGGGVGGKGSQVHLEIYGNRYVKTGEIKVGSLSLKLKKYDVPTP